MIKIELSFKPFLQLDNPLNFDENVGMIDLPSKDEEIDENAELIMTGWGTTMGSPIHPVNMVMKYFHFW